MRVEQRYPRAAKRGDLSVSARTPSLALKKFPLIHISGASRCSKNASGEKHGRGAKKETKAGHEDLHPLVRDTGTETKCEVPYRYVSIPYICSRDMVICSTAPLNGEKQMQTGFCHSFRDSRFKRRCPEARAFVVFPRVYSQVDCVRFCGIAKLERAYTKCTGHSMKKNSYIGHAPGDARHTFPFRSSLAWLSGNGGQERSQTRRNNTSAETTCALQLARRVPKQCCVDYPPPGTEKALRCLPCA